MYLNRKFSTGGFTERSTQTVALDTRESYTQTNVPKEVIQPTASTEKGNDKPRYVFLFK